ncbi:protein IWS1 homolog [Garra rufa]|uniref:protein IWS1 homolog n=2 Tax=Garra rufa TaxID=137080 RepID=UPI003CCE993C
MDTLLDFEECIRDSPAFRQSLDKCESDVAELESRVEKVMKLCSQMVEAGQNYTSCNQLFLSGLAEFTAYHKSDSVILNCLRQFNQGLQEMIQFQTMLFDQTQRAITQQLTNLLSQFLPQIRDTRREFVRIGDDLDATVMKNAQVSRHKPADAERATHLLLATRKCYQHFALDYCLQLNNFKVQQKLDILNSVFSYFHAQYTFFHQGFDLLRDLEPTMKTMASQLSQLSSDCSAKRKDLENTHLLVQQRRKKAILSDSDEDEDKEPKKSRLVSDDEDSGSDEASGGPDKSLAAKLKELGSDSEDEEDMKRDAGNKNEKALFGSDSDSGDDVEEKMIADIFGESGDEEEEEFTGFNQEELEAERPQAHTLGQKGLENESDSDDDVDRGGKDMSFMSDFDMMLARKKAQSGKRRRNRDGGTFISDADDVVSAMITKMTEAAEEDRTLNSQKKPALKKLMLLPTVVMHLKKQDLKETFIDSGVMTAIKEWISPLPDKSLPALKIREELLKILQELPSVSQETLKLSGIGRSVMYLYKHPKESRPNKDLALKLINEWSRPIFGLSSNYKGMTREERQQRDLDQQIAPRRRLSEPQTSERQEEPDVFAPALSSGGQTPRRDLEKVLTGEEKALRPGDPGFCARARVPMPSNKDYVVRPKWNTDGDSNRGPLKKGLSRVDKQMRRFADIKRLTKPGHAVKISVEGNRMPL